MKKWARWIGSVAAALLLTICFSIRPSNAVDEGGRATGVPAHAVSAAAIDFSDLAQREFSQPNLAAHYVSHRPLPRPDLNPAEQSEEFPPAAIEGKHRRGKSPQPEVSFAGTGHSGWIPPDTQGAVGPHHIMEALNGAVQITDRNGIVLKSVSLLSFWSSVGGISEVFDPRVTYDPYNDRWISSAGANPQASSSAILIGVSQTGDPAGAWNLYKIAADPSATTWADAPTLGFNTNWIVVQGNLFAMTNSFSNSTLWVFNKANLYAAGSGLYTRIQEPSGFADLPATIYDNSITTMYLVESYSPAAGRLRISTITGPVGSEVLTVGVAFPTSSSTWRSSAGTVNLNPKINQAARWSVTRS